MPPTLSEVETLAAQLPLPEQRALIARLQVRVSDAPGATGRSPRSLHGIWRGRFPEDLDLDAALRQIRNRWTDDLEGTGK